MGVDGLQQHEGAERVETIGIVRQKGGKEKVGTRVYTKGGARGFLTKKRRIQDGTRPATSFHRGKENI